jgi:hypothetical protein
MRVRFIGLGLGIGYRALVSGRSTVRCCMHDRKGQICPFSEL